MGTEEEDYALLQMWKARAFRARMQATETNEEGEPQRTL